MLASYPAHKVNQITAEPRKSESASSHPALKSAFTIGHSLPSQALFCRLFHVPFDARGPLIIGLLLSPLSRWFARTGDAAGSDDAGIDRLD